MPDTIQDEKQLKWYQGITKYQWMVLAVASVGWVFDVYEGQLFAIYKSDAIKATLDLSNLSEEQVKSTVDLYVQYAMASFLIGGAVGGLIFGVMADRIGRRKTMVISILMYSLFTGMHYFATEWQHIIALRFLVAMGVGGEWAIAAALVAEVFPQRSRAAASGIFHASSVLGVVLAVLTRLTLAECASQDLVAATDTWRWAFLVGFVPALLVLWVRASVKESERWESKAASDGTGGSLKELLGDPILRSRALVGLGLASIGMASYWAIVPWAKDLVDGIAKTDNSEVGAIAYLVMNLTGSLVGLLMFAPIASRWGRKKAFIFYHVGAFVSVPAAFLISSTVVQAFVLLSIMSFFVVGMHAGYAIYFPELFPTHLRATGASFCFNVGRLLSAVMLVVRGELRALLGLNDAVASMSVLFLFGVVLLVFAPETKDEELPD
jgi:MFS family permease